jgi:hypothetical protein
MNLKSCFLTLSLVSAVFLNETVPVASAQVQSGSPADQKTDKPKGSKGKKKKTPSDAPHVSLEKKRTVLDDNGSGNENPPSLGHAQPAPVTAPATSPK